MVTRYLEYTTITSDLEKAPEGYQSVRGVKSSYSIKSEFTEDEYVRGIFLEISNSIRLCMIRINRDKSI